MMSSIVLAIEYSATFVVTETSSNNYAMLAVSEPENILWLADNGYIDTDGRDTRIETLGGLEKPHLVGFDRILTAIPVPADSQTNLYFTTDNTSASMDIIAGYGGYVTVADDADLELGDIFNITFEDAWVDTSAGATKNLVLKTSSIYTSVSAASTITSLMYGSINTTETLAPNGAGSVTNIPTLFGAATHWQANLTNDGDTSYVENTGAVQSDLYATTDSAIIGDPTIDSVVVYIVCSRNLAGTANAYTYLRTNAANFSGVANALGAGYVAYSTTYANNPQTVAPWTWAEVNAMEIGVQLEVTVGPENARCTQVYAVVNYDSVYQLVLTPVTSGEYTVATYSDGVNFMLSLDGDTSWDGVNSDRTATGGDICKSNANNWTLGQSNVLPYYGSYSHSVDTGGGLTLIAHYHPAAIVLGEAYAVGTVTVTNGDATVEGAGGMAWDDDMIGSIFVSADGLQYVVLSVTDADTLELTAVYAGGTLAGQAYNLYVRLPDLQGASEDGRITWGTNPAGVAVELGGLVSVDQPIPGDTIEEPALDIIPAITISDWYVEPAVTGSLLSNPARPFVVILSDTTSMTEMQAWRLLGTAFVLFCTVVAAIAVRNHLLIAGITCGVATGLMVALTIFPLWAVVFIIGAIASGVIAERSPSI